MEINELIKLFKVSKSNNNIFQCKCPAHDDLTASLTITNNKDKILLFCHAGCSLENILQAVNLNIKDLFNSNNINQKVLLRKYNYEDENGNLIHSTLRFIDNQGHKSFLQCSYKNNKEIYSLKGIKTYLYKLPELIEEAALGRDIYIVEGEKDVENLRSRGISATTAPMGANKWRDSYNKYFKNANVVIIPDNDIPGKGHAELIYNAIKDIAFSVKIVNLPNLTEKEDVTDWFNKFHTVDELFDIVNATQTFNKRKETIIKIKEENEIHKKNLEIEFIQDFIYTKEDKRRLISFNVCKVLAENFNICTSIMQGKRQYFIYRNGFWEQCPRDYISHLFVHWLYPTSCTSNNIKNVIELLHSLPEFSVDENKFNSLVNYVNLNNCSYNLEKMQAEPHNPEHFFTYKTSYDYNPDSVPVLFNSSLSLYSLNNPDWIKAFWEIAGYCMIGSFQFQKMFWFTGSKGRNGKGTCIRIIEYLVGEKFTVSDIDTREFRERFYKSRLIGKRLATAGDLHNRVANISTLKQLTGGDKQMTDIKFSEARSFTNVAKFIFAMNQLPELPHNENITPIAKRILILPFEYEIKIPDANIEDKMMLELSGIFNMAIEGLKRLKTNREFTEVERGIKVLELYRKNIPIFENFVVDNISYDTEFSGTFLYTIWDRYLDYMKDVFGGDNWKNDKDIPIKNVWNLSESIRKYFFDKKIDLRIEKKSSHEKRSTYTFLHNIYLK